MIKNMSEYQRIEPPSIYEVIRVIDGVALYVEEHLNRMYKSANLMGYYISKSSKEIKTNINKLIKANGYKDLNIKLVFSDLDSEEIFLMYYIDSYYPEKSEYKEGVKTISIKAKRKNPNAKVINENYKSYTKRKIKENGAYEAMLINEEGFITEGSRSNVFFVKGDILYTAPPGDVLLGVTRNKIMEACKDLGYKTVEKLVNIDEINDYEGVFITGTSIDVLPVTWINNTKFSSVDNKIIKNVRNEYLRDVKKYINEKKSCLV
ncbi:MAG: branched-chain amino acid aminotransferase [Firmicutes bacterium]|nr:branched-chain amino acid aminotransferase [Bacillota bacterium]